MPNTDREWRKWGRQDPYFGVLASPKFARANIGGSKDAFFATGEQFVAALLAEAPATSKARALDHGCGTGRLTIPLSRAYRQVVALDVAPEMLVEADANARTAARDNILFAEADDDLSRAEGQFDLIVSHLVLQHIPVRRGVAIFTALLDRLAPGAIFHIDVSIRNDVGSKRWLYWASATIPGVKIAQNLLRGVAWNAPAMQMNDYPLNSLIAELAKRRIHGLTVAVDAFHPRFQTVALRGTTPPA